MKTVIITMRNRETGQRWVFHEKVHSSTQLQVLQREICKKSPELAFVKMTVKR